MITSVDNQRVKDVLRLRKSRERKRSGLFVAEGPREVERARAAGLRIVQTYYAPAIIDWGEGETVSDRMLAKMAYREEPEGVLAVVEAPSRSFRRTVPCTSSRSGSRSPGTSAAMARSAEVAGADALSSPRRRPTSGTRMRSGPPPEPSSRCPWSRRR